MTKELILRWEIILIIPVGPMKSQGSLHGKEGGRGARDVTMEANTGVMGGPRVKECRQLLEARKGEEMGSPLELPEETQQNKFLNT